MVHQVCTEQKWGERHPSSFTSCMVAQHCCSPMFPVTDRHRETSAAEEENHKLYDPLKCFQMESTPHVSEETKHSLKLGKTKLHSKNPPKAQYERKSEKRSALRFHSDLEKSRGCRWRKKKGSLFSLDNPISRCKYINTQRVSSYIKPAQAIAISLGCK